MQPLNPPMEAQGVFATSKNPQEFLTDSQLAGRAPTQKRVRNGHCVTLTGTLLAGPSLGANLFAIPPAGPLPACCGFPRRAWVAHQTKIMPKSFKIPVAGLATSKPTAILEPTQIEVGNGHGYRWAPAYYIITPDGRKLYPPMQGREARAYCQREGWKPVRMTHRSTLGPEVEL